VTALLAAALALAGCGEDTATTFARIENKTETIADFQRFQIQGLERLEYRASVPADVLHPEFLISWTNLARDIEVDVYVVREEDYLPDIPPSGLAPVFWTSVPQVGPLFGDRRPTLIHLHPEPGNWVIVFYNPNQRQPNTRAILSATIELSYFK
jgi:hypothetical protein